jgi:hypothetical protein
MVEHCRDHVDFYLLPEFFERFKTRFFRVVGENASIRGHDPDFFKSIFHNILFVKQLFYLISPTL